MHNADSNTIPSTLKCTKCEASVTDLNRFPNGLCLECYTLTREANAPLTVTGLADLTNMWRGKR